MPRTRDMIQDVIKTLDQEVRLLAERENAPEVVPAPQPPATDAEIRDYEKHLGRKLPPSYREFLKLHNGYRWLAYPGHMLSVQSVMPGGEYYEDIQRWKKISAKYGSGEVLDGIVIAYLEQPNNWVYLDPNQPRSEGELTVVDWDPEESQEYGDVVEFLEECIGVCRVDMDAEDEEADEDEDEDEDEDKE